MKSAESWLSEYGESHTNKTNIAIHEICVPLIMHSLLGMMWFIPTPGVFDYLGEWGNWTIVFCALCILFYISLRKIMLLLGLLFLLTPMLIITVVATRAIFFDYLYICIAIFIVSWIGQFIGHKIEGKKPSFFKDLLFLLIGPMWVVSNIYKKLNIRY